ncbi:MAG: DNA repair protein RadA, partial [Muribaculaceae bacterium]|nr:DNA repair protein RadA [Muribaculaceae bacterium]
FKLAQKDVFLNIAGGLRVTDPALDLAVICAILSSNVDMPIRKGICFSGEVGLSGELRPITRVESRIAEAQKLGFDTIIIPKHNTKGVDLTRTTIKIVEAAKVEEAFAYLFG